MSVDFRTRQAGALFAEKLQIRGAPGRGRREFLRGRALAEPLPQRLMRACADLAFCARPSQWKNLQRAAAAVLGAHRGETPAQRMYQTAKASDGFVGLALNVSPAVVADGFGRGLNLGFIFGRPCWFAPALQASIAPRLMREPQAVLDLLASHRFRFSMDRNFDQVVAACTANAVAQRAPFQPGHDGMRIFASLFDAGFAHSLEIRDRAGVLTGGLYGIAHNHGFFTLGRFGSAAHVDDLALVVMNRHLAHWGYGAHQLPTLQCTSAEAEVLLQKGFAALQQQDCAAMAAGRPGAGRLVRWNPVAALIDGSAQTKDAAAPAVRTAA